MIFNRFLTFKNTVVKNLKRNKSRIFLHMENVNPKQKLILQVKLNFSMMPGILIVNNAEPGISEFTTPVEKIVEQAGAKPVTIEYADCPDFNFAAFDGVILTGSPQGDDIIAHHLPYFLWIKDFDKPVLGICAGHHITGFMYGSEILRSEEPESGDFYVEVVKSNFLFNEIPHTFKVKQMHHDSVTLPADFELLATSKTCRNQIMKHRTKPIYTCQFHPEYYNQKLIENFVTLCR